MFSAELPQSDQIVTLNTTVNGITKVKYKKVTVTTSTASTPLSGFSASGIGQNFGATQILSITFIGNITSDVALAAIANSTTNKDKFYVIAKNAGSYKFMVTYI